MLETTANATSNGRKPLSAVISSTDRSFLDILDPFSAEPVEALAGFVARGASGHMSGLRTMQSTPAK
jgi:hypothetical protein